MIYRRGSLRSPELGALRPETPVATSRLLLTGCGLGAALGAAVSLFPGDEEAVLRNLLSTGAAVQGGQEALDRVVRICPRPAVPTCPPPRPLAKRSVLVPGAPSFLQVLTAQPPGGSGGGCHRESPGCSAGKFSLLPR